MGRSNPAYDAPLSDDARRLAERHYWLVRRRVVDPWCLRYPDLWSEILDAAHDGLVMAAQAYPPGCGRSFATFALNKAKWSILSLFRARRNARKRPRPETLDEDDWDAGVPPARPDRRPDCDEAFESLLAHATPAEAEVLRLTYRDGLTQREAAAATGRSQPGVNALAASGLGRIRSALEGRPRCNASAA